MPKEPHASSGEIGSNLERLQDLLVENKRELTETLHVMDSLLVPLADPDGRIARIRLGRERALQTLMQRGAIVGELIQKYAITTRVDGAFLSGMLLLSEGHLVTPPETRDSLFFQHESEVVDKAVVDLKVRRLGERTDREEEEEHAVAISEGRTFKFFLSEDLGKVRMDMPVVVDPYDYKIEIGPEAVDQILGAKLTLDDYKRIAETLISLPGEAGKAIRAYAQAVDIWAQCYSSGLPTDEALEIRKLRSYNLRTVFGGADPKVSPFCDIPLNAIYMYEVDNYPQITLDHLPQPFEN